MAKLGKLSKLKVLQRKKPYLVYSHDFMNKTALHWAIIRRKPECAHFLIKKKSYINAKDALGKHSLFYAIQTKSMSLVFILLKMKVKVMSDVPLEREV
jgi:ankyrin repeat protein